MNRIVIALAMLATVGLANDRDGDWFPAPNGFVWSAVAANQPTKAEQVRTADMPDALRSYLAEQWKPQPLPESLYACRADLNGDGVMEWFIDIPFSEAVEVDSTRSSLRRRPAFAAWVVSKEASSFAYQRKARSGSGLRAVELVVDT